MSASPMLGVMLNCSRNAVSLREAGAIESDHNAAALAAYEADIALKEAGSGKAIKGNFVSDYDAAMALREAGAIESDHNAAALAAYEAD
ncbi:MAG: hypothetical protein IKC73_00480, partial [Clostridia bacterium]|nr:hypothetical protein [Clostridia bacterium]